MVVLQQRPRVGKRYIPDRPPGGYVIDQQDPKETRFRADAVPRALASITNHGERMATICHRRDRIMQRLSDPNLLESIPIGDRRRLEAEDLIDELDSELIDIQWAVARLASDVASAGRYLSDQRLDEIGRQFSIHDPPLAIVNDLAPGVLTHATWQRLVAAAPPF